MLSQVPVLTIVVHCQAVEISNALDAENTEQDVSAAGESLENLAESEAGIAGGDVALEDIMDQHSQVRSEQHLVWIIFEELMMDY